MYFTLIRRESKFNSQETKENHFWISNIVFLVFPQSASDDKKKKSWHHSTVIDRFTLHLLLMGLSSPSVVSGTVGLRDAILGDIILGDAILGDAILGECYPGEMLSWSSENHLGLHITSEKHKHKVASMLDHQTFPTTVLKTFYLTYTLRCVYFEAKCFKGSRKMIIL